MPNAEKLEKKQKYFDKLINLCETCPAALIVEVDFVGSLQMQRIRTQLRGKCQVLMGKNTMIRTALRKRIEETNDESLQVLLDNINGNMGFIFCLPGKAGAMELAREILAKEKVPAAAKAGVISPIDVHIPAGPSGLEPSQISFCQALNIATKIVKGAIEFVSAIHLLKINDKVSLSAAAFLAKLNIKPFEYGMKIRQVYQDGAVFDAAVLDINDQVLMSKFLQGVSNIAALGREIGIPTEAALPHMFANSFKNVAALISDLEYTFAEVETVKAFLKDPSAFAAANAGPAAAASGGGAAAAPAAAAAVEEEEEDDMEFDLFD